MSKAMNIWLCSVRSSLRMASGAAVLFGVAASIIDARAEDLQNDAAVSRNPDEGPSDLRSWQEHVRAEKRRIRELAAQRRRDGLPDSAPSLSNEDRWASERVLNDLTLERGDIVVTDKGAFVFRGQIQGERSPGDFEPVAGFAFRR